MVVEEHSNEHIANANLQLIGLLQLAEASFALVAAALVIKGRRSGLVTGPAVPMLRMFLHTIYFVFLMLVPVASMSVAAFMLVS